MAADDAEAKLIAQLRERVSALEQDLSQQRPQAIKSFSFADEEGKCKLYVELGQKVLASKDLDQDSLAVSEAAASVAFLERTCELHVHTPSMSGGVTMHYAATFVFESEIVPDKCVWKVDRPSGRIVIALKKADASRTWGGITTSSMRLPAAGNGELVVTVHVQRRLGTQVSKAVPKGTTVRALKQMLAQEDSLGKAGGQEMGLMHTATGRVLGDAEVLTGEVTDLELCTGDVLSQPD